MKRPIPRAERIGETDWSVCELSDGQFRGFGGVPTLGGILSLFLS